MKRSLILAAALLASTSTVRAETLVALTATNQLITFDSATPGTLASTVAISGLAAGDALVGIDVRPANNILYGFAVDTGAGGAAAGVGRVYSINVGTGVATLAATLAADPADATPPTPYSSVSGTFFGVDFNPVADRLRVVSDTGLNLRINVATGLTQLDGAIAYAVGDANAGTPAQIYASAYTNSVAGAATTTLYNLDGSIGTLVTQNPPNNGTLNTVALASLAIFPDAAFDISGQTGVGYVVLDGATLSTISLANGDVTQLGGIGTIGAISDIAVLAIPEPAAIGLAALSLGAVIATRRKCRQTA
ncbi:MAG: hypothetical protein C0485_18570 [Pirellula sp.]|nr:hypothetical protein [Pirellula sp.]